MVNRIPVKRIIFKEILDGDRKKFDARSNDTQSGGGARDLRFSPYSSFQPVFEGMFPHINEKGVASGQFHWYENEQEVSKSAFFHPPTGSRGNEGRIANIDKFLPKERIPSVNEGTVFLLLIQDNNGKVWPSFATETSLLNDWHEGVKDMILSCHSSKRRANSATTGFVDFEQGGGFCNHD
ncbi:hypothetical protein [Paraliobacillus sp. X-1268]|uniref:hypothetical protein n=1 Tax=Paraliobacillus sp. X-1268 TaxID=2213193 RepID=UPI000E3B56FB|nr:hypothetical protein [Paraliobacillus sp. X-1268]